MEGEKTGQYIKNTRPEISNSVIVEGEKKPENKTSQISNVVDGLSAQVIGDIVRISNINRRFVGRPLFGTSSEVVNLIGQLNDARSELIAATDIFFQALSNELNEEEGEEEISNGDTYVGPSFYDKIEDYENWLHGQLAGIPVEIRIAENEKKGQDALNLLFLMREKMAVILDPQKSKGEKTEAQKEFNEAESKFLEAKMEIASYRAFINEKIFLEEHNPFEVVGVLEMGHLHPSIEFQAIQHARIIKENGSKKSFEVLIAKELEKLLISKLQGRGLYDRLTESSLVSRTGGLSRLLLNKLLNGYFKEASKDIDYLKEHDPSGSWEELRGWINEAQKDREEQRDKLQESKSRIYEYYPEELINHEYVQERMMREEVLRKGAVVSFGYLTVNKRDGSKVTEEGVFRPQRVIMEYNGKRVEAVVKFSFSDRSVRRGVTPGTGPERSVLETGRRLKMAGLLPTEEAVDLMKIIPLTEAREISVPTIGEDGKVENYYLGWAEVVELIEGDARQFVYKDVGNITAKQRQCLEYMTLFALAGYRNNGAGRNIIHDKDGNLVEIDYSGEGSFWRQKDSVPYVSVAHLLTQNSLITDSSRRLAEVMVSPLGQMIIDEFGVSANEILPLDIRGQILPSVFYKERMDVVKKIAETEVIPQYNGQVDECGDDRYYDLNHTIQP